MSSLMPRPPDGAEGAVYSEERVRQVSAPATVLWDVVHGIGGPQGWYAVDPLWRLRGLLDRMVGGPGMRGREVELNPGAELDFWRVVEVDVPCRLLLRAELRMPGAAWLELAVSDDRRGRSHLTQRTWFRPDGLVGHAFWWGELPAHKLVFGRMADNLAREAQRRARREGSAR